MGVNSRRLGPGVAALVVAWSVAAAAVEGPSLHCIGLGIGLDGGGPPISGDGNGVVPALGAVSEMAASPVDPAEVNRLLTARGFRCRRPVPGLGLTCVGRVGAYPKDVILIVPPGYRPTENAELVLHLHGHNPGHLGADYFIDHFMYSQGVAASHRNAIFVAPVSDNRCDEFEHDLAPPEKFKPFLDAVARLTQGAALSTSSDVGSVALSGHSGAYRSLATIVSGGAYGDRIHELYLFDAIYGRAPEFSAWAAKPGNRLWAVYHEWDNADFPATEQAMAKSFTSQGIPFRAPSEKDPTPAELAGQRIGFGYALHGLSHDGVVPGYYAMFLHP